MTEPPLFKQHPLVSAMFANLTHLRPLLFGGIAALALSGQASAFNQTPANVFINEIHYDNNGTDSGEAIEIGGPAGTDLTGWSLVLYNGSGGAVYGTTSLSGSIPNQQNGFGTISISYPSNGIQNGAPDGVALVDNLGAVVQFLSYEGSFTAVGGAANGLISTDIGVSETGLGALGESLQLKGSGSNYQNFTWAASSTGSFSAVNSGQNFSGSSSSTVNLSVSTNTGTEAGTTSITVTATTQAAVPTTQTVDLSVSGANITTGDYTLSNTTITIPAGSTSGSVTFTVVDDADLETEETATLTIGNPSSGISIGTTATQNIIITDNDTPVLPKLSIDDVSSNEGNNGSATYSFTVSLSAPAGTGGVTFDIATADGSANAGSDYSGQAMTGQTIAAGNSSYTFNVTVNGDATFESNENFLVNVSNISGANLLDGQGTGTIVNDDSACGTPATKISTVQGSGGISPLNGQSGISIEGIVVGDYQGASNNSLRGYFVQEEDTDTDADPLTSEGIFVFDSATLANVNVGDRVRVTGTPAEFFNMTQLGTLTKAEVCAVGQAIPTSAAITLPVPNVPDNDPVAATNAINSYYEAFEGMLVNFPTTLRIAEYFELERYGQLILSKGNRIPTFTHANNPSASGYINHQINMAKRQIILDDSNNIQNFYISSFAATNNIPLPYPTGGLSTTNRFRGDDTIANLTGVLHWSFAGQSGTDAWRIRPVEELFDYKFKPVNPRPAIAPNVNGELKIASFNVLNHFTSIDTTASNTAGACGPDGSQDCRGADSAAELARQTEKAASALCGINADIVGLMEIENNATASLDSLVTATNAISGCGPYAYINTGVIGGDAIKVGLLYKTSTVNAEGGHALLTTAIDSRFVDTKNRPSLAQTFRQTVNGEKLTVAVNHLKSKGSACNDIDINDVDANDGQGNCNLTRKNAAMALVDWLNSDPTGSNDPDFLIIGDLNSYAKEDPIKAIENGADNTAKTADDYTNLVNTFGGSLAYSYVFDGQTGYLDHALANKTLAAQVTGTTEWHINSDEPPSFDYNDTIANAGEASFEAKPAALPLYQADPYRTSDHDPIIIGLTLNESINVINGNAFKNVLVGTVGKDRITGFDRPDTLTGGLGNDEFVYLSDLDGIDTITDFTVGEDKIVLTALLQNVGYKGSNPIADGIIRIAAMGSDAVVSIDSDGKGPAVRKALIVVNNISATNLKNTNNFIF